MTYISEDFGSQSDPEYETIIMKYRIMQGFCLTILVVFVIL